MKTPKKLASKYTDDVFKDAQALQDFFHAGNKLKYDYVIVDGILYTMHEYDMEGQTLTFANKKHEMFLEISTSNRYHNGFTDAFVQVYPTYYLRTDIHYAE